MLSQSKAGSLTTDNYAMINQGRDEKMTALNTIDTLGDIIKQYTIPDLGELVARFAAPAGKRSFLVVKNNKYINILTENIAFFYVRYDSTIIVTFDKQEFFLNYSLEQIQQLLQANQFFRVNRQYLVSFSAIKEAEHYFARKLLVNLAIPTRDKLIVSKERVSSFLHWLDNR